MIEGMATDYMGNLVNRSDWLTVMRVFYVFDVQVPQHAREWLLNHPFALSEEEKREFLVGREATRAVKHRTELRYTAPERVFDLETMP